MSLTMHHMFAGASAFDQGDQRLAGRQGHKMHAMFKKPQVSTRTSATGKLTRSRRCTGCSTRLGFQSVDIGNWKVDKVKDMARCLKGLVVRPGHRRLERLFGVRDMGSMFGAASSFNQPLNDWRVDNVTNMKSMFYNASPSTRTSPGAWMTFTYGRVRPPRAFNRYRAWRREWQRRLRAFDQDSATCVGVHPRRRSRPTQMRRRRLHRRPRRDALADDARADDAPPGQPWPATAPGPFRRPLPKVVFISRLKCAPQGKGGTQARTSAALSAL